ncbi:hypothetical protein DFJ58DRAFT_911364 [Suillus subalutaceus]|uniref:uncharacterized protein n=1 Tax=Suillus subalutaceus TaxID=48586 RepID=UPI001B86D9C6|nr:uncharacterized protein DFJ58DRAFT_911364 [Suillus subalutaceus]KAG1869027.1 hypothetical protein DFJ58DRAFT_911364 [Suillus subalutaceus]
MYCSVSQVCGYHEFHGSVLGLITFADEVALIWCKHKDLIRSSWVPLSAGFVVNMVALTPLKGCGFRPKMTGIILLLRCRNFVRYQGVMAIIGVSIAELMMLMRVHALYRDRRLVAVVPGLLLLVWIAVISRNYNGSSYSTNTLEIHDFPPYEVIVLALSATRAWLPLAYDTAIFILTLWHTLPSHHRNGVVGHILQTFQSDGTLYYMPEEHCCSISVLVRFSARLSAATLDNSIIALSG